VIYRYREIVPENNSNERSYKVKKVLGVDCGNVILEQMNGTPVKNSVTALRAIVESGLFSDEDGVRIWVVSKCGPRVQTLSRQWLNEINFWNLTGIPESNLEFCLKFWEKEPICKRLGITHFIDDRPRVLNCLTSVGTLYAFNPEAKAMSEYTQQKPMIVVRSWDELLLNLLT
jgi:hypothetical protein